MGTEESGPCGEVAISGGSTVVLTISVEELLSIPYFEQALTDRFHPKESCQVHISTLRAKLRRPDEDLHQLRCDISRLVELAYPDDPWIYSIALPEISSSVL